MLRIIANTSSAGAASYYQKADYYTQGHELTGQWQGKGAAQLGLAGEVTQQAWEALCFNRDPQTGNPLKVRTNQNRTVGYDFNFHVPKSVSLLYSVAQDQRIHEVFRDCVRETMQDLESEMLTRVRKAGRNSERTTGNMVWGEFIHSTSRPVEGVPDPHLHAHCFVFNTTWDAHEKQWKAGQFRELKRDAPYFQAVFHTRLAQGLKELGYGIERQGKSWEIAGIPKEMVAAFSRRTAQIEALAKEQGIIDSDAKAELGAKTRARKQDHLSMADLHELWLDRLSPEQRQVLDYTQQVSEVSHAPPATEQEKQISITRSMQHCFERDSVVAMRVLLADTLRRGVGVLQPEELAGLLRSQGLISHQREGRRFVTTEAIIQEERQLLEFARQGRGRCVRLGERWQFRRDWLNSDQKKAVLHVIQSPDRVMLIRGAAGTGKTTMMQEAAEAIQAHGKRVFTFAPSSDASRGVLREAGFEDATTVAELLKNPDKQSALKEQVIWVDEASLLGTRTMSQVFDLAKQFDCRVILSGDRRQHRAVERGEALRLLEEEAGLMPAEIREIQRQQGEYKAAIAAISDGRTLDGFDQLDDLGWIHEIPDGEREQALAQDYLQTVKQGESVLVVSPTHAEGRQITQAIRSTLKQAGLIQGQEVTLPTLVSTQMTEGERADPTSYQPGDVLVFHQNAKGFQRGQRVEVDEGSIPWEQAEKFQRYRPGSLAVAPGDWLRITKNGFSKDGKHRLNNGALYRLQGRTKEGDLILGDNRWIVSGDYGFLDHGYVVTSYAAQGKSVHRVLIAESSASFPAASREGTLVALSRGKKSLGLYTDDKEGLREAIQSSSECMTATELMKPIKQSTVRHHVAHLKRLALQARAIAGRTVDYVREALRDQERSLSYDR